MISTNADCSLDWSLRRKTDRDVAMIMQRPLGVQTATRDFWFLSLKESNPEYRTNNLQMIAVFGICFLLNGN